MATQTVTPGTPLSITLAQGDFFRVTVPDKGTAQIYRTGADGTPIVDAMVGGPASQTIGPFLKQMVYNVAAIGAACVVDTSADVGFVVGVGAPNNADGRPNDTVYFQVAA